MKLLSKENAAGKINNKVYGQIQHRLQKAEKQLPVLKASLSLRKRYTWLGQVPLFSGLPKDLLQQLAEKCRYVNFLPGDTVFHENDKGYSLYMAMSSLIVEF